MTMKNTRNDRCIDTCNSLLAGEISAVETYNQAIDKFSGDPEAIVLADIRREHIASADRLRANVREMGGTPVQDSGAWGTFAKTAEGVGKLLGDSAALKVLQEGEEHGQSEYEEALESEDVMAECKEMIRVELLPRQHRHASMLRDLAGRP